MIGIMMNNGIGRQLEDCSSPATVDERLMSNTSLKRSNAKDTNSRLFRTYGNMAELRKCLKTERVSSCFIGQFSDTFVTPGEKLSYRCC